MKSFFLKLNRGNLIKDGFILFAGTMIGAVLTFFFHFLVARWLGPSDYGVLTVLMGIVYLSSVVTNTVQTGIANYVARLSSEAFSKIKDLSLRSLRKLSWVGLLATLVLAVLSPFIAAFLHIKTIYVLTLSPIVFFMFILPLNRGLLQGLQRFKGLSLNMGIEGVFKLLAAFILVFILGWQVMGSVVALITAVAIPFLFAFFYLKDVFSKDVERSRINPKSIYIYTIPVFLFLLSSTLFYTIDAFLVKHFFTSFEAGLYGAVSMIGKIIFFAVMPLTLVMFSKVSEIKRNTREARSLLKKTVGIIFGAGLLATLVFFLIPEFIVNIMYGSEYLAVSNLVGIFGVVMALFSIVYCLSYFLLAIHKYKFVFVLLASNVLEFAIIWFFHPSLFAILSILAVISGFLVITLFWFIYHENSFA